MATEPTETERQQATLVMARLPISLGDYRTRDLDATVAVLAQALADQRAEMIAAIQQSWDAQCAGNKAAHCESCRAYDDALTALGERSQL